MHCRVTLAQNFTLPYLLQNRKEMRSLHQFILFLGTDESQTVKLAKIITPSVTVTLIVLAVIAGIVFLLRGKQIRSAEEAERAKR